MCKRAKSEIVMKMSSGVGICECEFVKKLCGAQYMVCEAAARCQQRA